MGGDDDPREAARVLDDGDGVDLLQPLVDDASSAHVCKAWWARAGQVRSRGDVHGDGWGGGGLEGEGGKGGGENRRGVLAVGVFAFVWCVWFGGGVRNDISTFLL